jgi:hypothetical protein
MNINCHDRERIFLDGTPEEWAALQEHAAACFECQHEVAAWKSLSVAASELDRQWDSPALWPRIKHRLEQQSAAAKSPWWGRLPGNWNLTSLQWQTAAAALLLVTVTALAIWFIVRPTGSKIPIDQALFNDHTVREVEKAEAAYEQAIDKLDAQARPQLENAATPLMASYREKLQVLDSAIADLKSQTGMNPGNGHLRRQLLAMYQEKQDTLEEVLEAKQ